MPRRLSEWVKLYKVKLMFPGVESLKTTAKKHASFSKRKILVIGGGCLVAACLVAFFFVANPASTPVAIPDSIAKKVKYPIYLPTKLPGNYKIDENSLMLVEQDTVLLFEAKDGVGGNLIFSEQQRPQNFNFDSFHKDNLKNTETLSGVPYPSVWGKSIDDRTALSIVTEDTWILLVTSAPMDGNNMRDIVQNMRRY